jgi:arylsulfatase A-like enzyme
MPPGIRNFSSAAASLCLTLIGILVPGAVFAVALSLASGQAQGWTFYLTVPEIFFEAAVRLVAGALAAMALATVSSIAILPFLRYFEQLNEAVKRVAVAIVVFLDGWLVIAVVIGWLNVSGWRVALLFAAYAMIFTMIMTSPRGKNEVVTSLDGFLGQKASRRTAIATGVGTAALAAADFVLARTAPATVQAVRGLARPKPNILLITFDALSAEDLSLYGYRLPTTPNLDAFAGQATVFNNFCSASTFTTPSVATILTGLHPSESRVYHIPDRFRGAGAEKSLPQLMRAAGYATGASISNPYAWFLADSLNDAYDVLPAPPYRTGALKHLWDAGAPLHQRSPVGSRAQEFADLETVWDYVPDSLERWSPRRFGRLQSGYPPAASFGQAHEVMSKLGDGYFLWVHVMAPHLPYLPDPADRGRFLASDEMRTEQQQEPLKWWPHYDPSQQPQVDKARLRYDEFVASADRAFGAFLSQVDRTNTVVIVSADHGESFEGGVYTHVTAYQTRPVIHIPLIIRMPGQTETHRIEFTADQSALAPTILELAGQPKPQWMPGRSLAEWVKGNRLGTGEGLAFTQHFANNALSKPLRTGTVGVIDSHNQYVVDLATGKGNFRSLSEAHIWDRDHSAENPAAVDAMRAALYSRFPDIFRRGA